MWGSAASGFAPFQTLADATRTVRLGRPLSLRQDAPRATRLEPKGHETTGLISMTAAGNEATEEANDWRRALFGIDRFL